MKIVEKVLKRRLQCMMKEDKMQFGFIPGKETTDAEVTRGVLRQGEEVVYVLC